MRGCLGRRHATFGSFRPSRSAILKKPNCQFYTSSARSTLRFSRATYTLVGASVGVGLLGYCCFQPVTDLHAQESKEPPSPQPYAQQIAKKNVVLRDKHKIALAEWPATTVRNGDARIATIHSLFAHVKDCGYDGVEMCASFFANYFPGLPLEEVAVKVKAYADKMGLEIFGVNVWWVTPDFLASPSYKDNIRREAQLTRMMGGKYLSFQIWLEHQHMDTGGAYRRDKEYLEKCGRVIEELQEICHSEGMNCYIETHVGRISEDPQAFVEIMDKCKVNFEVNGDLSHYVYRNINKGEDMEKILSRLGHTHQRMARPFGDLSVNVDDVLTDWKEGGVTWKAFELTKRGLEGGLSSRVIVGESGPMHDVVDPLSVDAKLVPLWRAMAAYADASASGNPISVLDPTDLPLSAFAS